MTEYRIQTGVVLLLPTWEDWRERMIRTALEIRWGLTVTIHHTEEA